MTGARTHMPGAGDPGQVAAEWFARLRGEPALADWTRFQAWLEADPAHREAYDAVEALWIDLDDASEPAALPRAANDHRRPRPPMRRRIWWGAAGLAAAAAIVALVGPAPWRGAPQRLYATGPGQQRTIALEDGSTVTLGAASRLRVEMTTRRRAVDLVDGVASFDVAHQAGRPFVVGAGDRTVRVLGTEFNVWRHDERLAVTVRRGVVAVSDKGDASSVRLVAGQRLTRDRSGPAVVRAVDPEAAFAWRRGRLVYEQAALADVAADLGRYGASSVRISPSAARIRVTGVFQVDDQAAMIRRLEMFAPVTVEDRGGEIWLRPRPARP